MHEKRDELQRKAKWYEVSVQPSRRRAFWQFEVAVCRNLVVQGFGICSVAGVLHKAWPIARRIVPDTGATLTREPLVALMPSI